MGNGSAATTTGIEQAPAQRPGMVRWYVVTILGLVYAVNIADRYVVSTVMESIRLDLQLTDSGIALLTGTALALFYVTIGIPISAFADRTNRRNIVAGSLILWSVFTVLCGSARNFWQLLLARIGVGVGEAGGTPPSTSMLADWFPASERAMALTFYSLGAPIGAWLGADVAGRIADAHGWRTAFYALGVPGVLLGLIVLLTIREPARGRLEAAASAAAAPTISLAHSLRFILSQRSAMHLMMAGAVTALWGWGLMWWTPTFLMRSYGMTAGQAGMILGPIHIIAGSGATIATCRLMAMKSMADPRRILWLMAGVVAVITVPSFMIYYTHNLNVAIIGLWIFVPAMYFYIGPSLGLLANVVPPQMRATATAVTLLMANIANLVIAPQAVGFVSDHLAGPGGANAASLRIGLLLLAPTGLWAAWHYWAASRRFARDEDSAAGWREA